MEDYQRIREIELDRTKDYSNRKFNWYFRAHKLLRFLYSELFFWSISLLSMLIFPILIAFSMNSFVLFSITITKYYCFILNQFFH